MEEIRQYTCSNAQAWLQTIRYSCPRRSFLHEWSEQIRQLICWTVCSGNPRAKIRVAKHKSALNNGARAQQWKANTSLGNNSTEWSEDWSFELEINRLGEIYILVCHWSKHTEDGTGYATVSRAVAPTRWSGVTAGWWPSWCGPTGLIWVLPTDLNSWCLHDQVKISNDDSDNGTNRIPNLYISTQHARGSYLSCRGNSFSQPLLDVPCNCKEYLLHVLICFCTLYANQVNIC